MNLADFSQVPSRTKAETALSLLALQEQTLMMKSGLNAERGRDLPVQDRESLEENALNTLAVLADVLPDDAKLDRLITLVSRWVDALHTAYTARTMGDEDAIEQGVAPIRVRDEILDLYT